MLWVTTNALYRTDICRGFLSLVPMTRCLSNTTTAVIAKRARRAIANLMILILNVTQKPVGGVPMTPNPDEKQSSFC